MRGTTVKPRSSVHPDLAGDEYLARSEERKWTFASTILLIVAINTFLWTATYLGLRQLF